MRDIRFAGPLIRMLRLKADWSQETLSKGICAVSYLSKIEQGKVQANEALIADLFFRLGVEWADRAEDRELCDKLYDSLFSWDHRYLDELIIELDRIGATQIGPCFLDFTLIRAFYNGETSQVPVEMVSLLDRRQMALWCILNSRHEQAYNGYPCPLTAYCVAEEAYLQGNYTYALEYFQIAYGQAAREGYVYLMMVCQSYMANCYADIGNMDAMQRHSAVASRLARAVGDTELLSTVQYNLAATEVEFGNYEAGYRYFSGLKEHSVLSLHKLAVCCEGLGRNIEALDALHMAEEMAGENTLEKAMCGVVRYRLEHREYLKDPDYGKLLMETFQWIRRERHYGFTRFHLCWVTQWLTENRKYKEAFEIVSDFPKSSN